MYRGTIHEQKGATTLSNLNNTPQPSYPSRRQNKNKSGRQYNKSANGRRDILSVGGYSNPYLAIFAPQGKELCHVVPMETGMRDGKPFRDVGPGTRVRAI